MKKINPRILAFGQGFFFSSIFFIFKNNKFQIYYKEGGD